MVCTGTLRVITRQRPTTPCVNRPLRFPATEKTSPVCFRKESESTMSTEEHWRELRAQGAQLDAAARAAPGRRHLEAVPEATNAAKPLGLVWVVTPSYSITTEGLKNVL